MSEFKGTRGELEIENFRGLGSCIDIVCSDTHEDYAYTLLQLYRKEQVDYKTPHNAEMVANANLIVDAFKVRQQINCELSELLEQNNENLKVFLIDSSLYFFYKFKSDWLEVSGINTIESILYFNLDIKESVAKELGLI